MEICLVSLTLVDEFENDSDGQKERILLLRS